MDIEAFLDTVATGASSQRQLTAAEAFGTPIRAKKNKRRRQSPSKFQEQLVKPWGENEDESVELQTSHQSTEVPEKKASIVNDVQPVQLLSALHCLLAEDTNNAELSRQSHKMSQQFWETTPYFRAMRSKLDAGQTEAGRLSFDIQRVYRAGDSGPVTDVRRPPFETDQRRLLFSLQWRDVINAVPIMPQELTQCSSWQGSQETEKPDLLKGVFEENTTNQQGKEKETKVIDPLASTSDEDDS